MPAADPPPNVDALKLEAERQFQFRLDEAGTNQSELCLEALLAACAPTGDREHYKYFSPSARGVLESIGRTKGPKAQRLALCLAILLGLIRTLESDAFKRLPQRIAVHQRRQFARIVKQSVPSAPWMSMDDDLFHKDFGLATLRLYAAAAQLVDPRCGIPRSIVLAGGVGRLPAAAASLWRLGGFRPYFQIHTHTAYLDEFNEEGWNECYRCCADLYALHPAAKGMFGASWFYDPQIESISPRLAYLSQVPLQAGAERLFMAAEGEFVKDAISTSPTRRQLHEQGRYVPHSYMLAWGQAAQRAWALRNPASPTL